MKNRIYLLRISYWAGAILDGLMVIPMLFPKVGGVLFGIPDFNPSVEYKYAMGVGASLMAGWTILLIWADRKPIERKGVLLITVFPVLLGLVVAGIYAVAQNLIPIEKMVPTWIIQILLTTLFTYSFFSVNEKGGTL
jgi:hypothetical protein